MGSEEETQDQLEFEFSPTRSEDNVERSQEEEKKEEEAKREEEMEKDVAPIGQDLEAREEVTVEASTSHSAEPRFESNPSDSIPRSPSLPTQAEVRLQLERLLLTLILIVHS